MLLKIYVTTLLLAAASLWLPSAAIASCSGTQCPITGGSIRYQIGNAVPFPIAGIFTNPPTGPTGLINTANTAQGALHPISGAQVTVGGNVTSPSAGEHPRSIQIKPGQLTYGGGSAPVVNLGIFNFEPLLFSVASQLNHVFPAPGSTAVFQAGGRVGPPTVVMCPGAPVPTASFNPACLSAGATASGGATDWSGIMTYTATLAQFGGEGSAHMAAPRKISLAVNVAGETAVPCTNCVFGLQPIAPGSTWVMGAGWNAHQFRAPVVNTPGFFIGDINSSGRVTNVIGPTPSSDPFAGQTSESIGGPWTTGRISATVPGNVPPLTFVFTGSDQRNPTTGEGTISMVSAGLANRTVTDPSPGRGWMTITVPEPGSMTGLAAGIAMLIGIAQRRRLKSLSSAR